MSMDEEILKRLRARVLYSSSFSGEGHIPTSFSILEIIYSYYAIQKKIYGSILKSPNQIILSKGHAAIGLYAILEHFELIPSNWLDDFSTFNSPLGGHPDMTKVPHVVASTGSLGHGLPIGVGIALGKRIQGNPGMTYVLVGDGELNEGSNWESLMVAAHHKLSNLTVIVDCNRSSDRAVLMESLEDKLLAFGLKTHKIDGHSLSELRKFFETGLETSSGIPVALLAATIKGKGVQRMERSPNEWHHKIPAKSEMEQLIKEIK